jgi:hypothetical protein
LPLNINRYQIRLNQTLLNYDAYLQCGLGNKEICNTNSINDLLTDMYQAIYLYNYTNTIFFNKMDQSFYSNNPLDFQPYIDYYYTTILTQTVIDQSTVKN